MQSVTLEQIVQKIANSTKGYIDKTIPQIVKDHGLSAAGVSKDRVPTANGDGTWDWKDQKGGSAHNIEYKSPIERIGLYWGDGIVHGNIESNARLASTLDVVGISGVEHAGDTTEMSDTILRSKEINPNLRWVRYVDAGSGKTKEQMYEGIRSCINFQGKVSFDGIFFDQFDDITHCGEGKEYIDSIHRQNDLIEYAHSLGLFVIGNAWDFLSHVTKTVNTWNTLGIESAMNEKDYWLIESCTFTPDDNPASSTFNCGKWGGINSPQKLYTYYKNYFNKTCRAHAIDFSSSGSKMTKEDQDYELNWLMFSTLARGGHSVCFDRGNLILKETNSVMAPYFYDDYNDVAITNPSSGQWQIVVNGHTIRCVMDSTLSGVADKNSFFKAHVYLDGQEINNMFGSIGAVSASYDKDINKIQQDINILNETFDVNNKNNVSIYHRAIIDDWSPTPTIDSYDNLLDDMKFIRQNGITLETIDGTDLTGNYSNWTAWGDLSYEVDIPYSTRGKEIEFGATEFNGANKNLRMIVSNDATAAEETVYMNTNNLSVVNNPSGLCVKYTIPSDATKLRVRLQCFGGEYGENLKWSVKHWYAIDPSAIPELNSRTWYSNIFPTQMNVTNLGTNYTFTRNVDDKDRIFFDLNGTVTTSWGALRHDYSATEIEKLRGHTLELGMTSFDLSTEDSKKRSIKFILGANWQAQGVFYNTLERSEAFGDDRPCIRYTIPEDATALTVGLQDSNSGAGQTYSISDLYLYDLDEQGIIIRGKNPSSTWVTISRIKESVEEETPSNAKNSLYITDTGKLWITDFSGNKIQLGVSAAEVQSMIDESIGSILGGSF